MDAPSDIFIPGDAEGDRHRTAVLLVGTAREFNIPQRTIRSTYNGFYINADLYDAIYGEEAETAEDGVDHSDEVPARDVIPAGVLDEAESAALTSTTTQTSGNRAAKKTPKKGTNTNGN